MTPKTINKTEIWKLSDIFHLWNILALDAKKRVLSWLCSTASTSTHGWQSWGTDALALNVCSDHGYLLKFFAKEENPNYIKYAYELNSALTVIAPDFMQLLDWGSAKNINDSQPIRNFSRKCLTANTQLFKKMLCISYRGLIHTCQPYRFCR